MRVWLFNPREKTKTATSLFIDKKKEIDKRLLCPAYAEGIDPREYYVIKDILGCEDPMHIAPYTVRITKTKVYKVWAKDLYIKNGPATRFFDNTSSFFDNVLLVKYERPCLPPIDLNMIVAFQQHPCNLFYEASDILSCENLTKFEWLENGIAGYYSYMDSEKVLQVRDMMYVCDYCGKHCSGQKCGGCKQTKYCNKDCQKNHWPVHKLVCKKL